MTRSSHQPACSRAELGTLLASWRHPRFSPALLMQRTICTSYSAARREITPGTQVRRACIKELAFNQRGIVSMVAVLFITILLSIIVLGMVRLTVAEQRLSTDFLLSNKANYAAEAGVDDAVFRLRNNNSISQTCGDPLASDAIETDGPQVISEYTCQIIESNSGTITDSIERGKALQIDLSSLTSAVSRLRLFWYRGIDDAPNFAYTFWPGNNPTVGSPNMAPVLRAELIRYPDAGLRRGNIEQAIEFLRPVAAGSTATAADNWRLATTAGDAAKVISSTCQPAASTSDTDYACTFDLTGLDPASFNYVLRVSSFYERAPVSFRLQFLNSSNVEQPQSDIQATIDVTARAADVFRRVVYRFPLTDFASSPSYVLGAGDLLCKDLEVSNVNLWVRSGGNDGCSVTPNPN